MARLVLLFITAFLLHLGLTRHANAMVLLALALVQASIALALAASGKPRGLAARIAPLASCLALPACLMLSRSGVVGTVLISHTTLYGGLTVLFGRSLLPGHEPLVTAMARKTEPVLTAEMRSYTRRVTWAWTLYGPAQIGTSLILLAFAPLHAWSVFVNLLDPPLLVAMFLGEFACRRWCLHGSSTASLRDTLLAARQYWQPDPPT
jgi:uncharacterized membrane protein